MNKDGYDDIASSLFKEFSSQPDSAGSAQSTGSGAMPAAKEVRHVSFGAGAKPMEELRDDPNAVFMSKGNSNMDTITIQHQGSGMSAEVYLFGATLTSWKLRSGNNIFFVSQVAQYDNVKPIRGGIPLIFPQFGMLGDLPQHGFARNTLWAVKEMGVLPDNSCHVVLTISSESIKNQASAGNTGSWTTEKTWTADYAITLGFNGLETALTIKNTGTTPLTFTTAFHNYFQLFDINNIRVFGLEKTQYRDRMMGDSVHTEIDDGGVGLQVTKATDKLYMNTNLPEVALFDFTSFRLIQIRKTANLPDCVLWNPYGSEGCDPGWKNFVCVEPAAVSTPATVAPGASQTFAQLLSAE